MSLPLFELTEPDHPRPRERGTTGLGLRPYQADAVERLRGSIAAGHKRPLLVMPTGSGKTICARAIVEGAMDKDRSVLFLAPRRELIYQTSEKLDAAGVRHGILMAGEERHLARQVQVASVPTLHSRIVRAQRMEFPPADVVVLDEAHIGISRMTLDVLAGYEGRVIVGLTATPIRSDGRGLGEVFDDIVLGSSVSELTGQNFLVPARYFAPTKPDLEGVATKMGDWHQGQLGARMDDAVLIGDVVSNWLRLARDRQTVVFAVNVAHSVHLCERFREEGVRAEHLDANTPLDQRRDIMRRVHNGDIEVLCNVDVMSYGVDIPPLSACVIARPTKSLARYLQMAGRVLRPAPGKVDTLVIDHGAVIDRLGFLDDTFPWSLDGRETVQERQAKMERVSREPKPLTCPECKTVFKARGDCPNCGYVLVKVNGRPAPYVEADLEEINGRRDVKLLKARGKAAQWTPEQKQRFYSELLWWADSKGYKEGWAYHKYVERLKVAPPNGFSKARVGTCYETEQWIRSRQIAWAKRKRRADAA